MGEAKNKGNELLSIQELTVELNQDLDQPKQSVDASSQAGTEAGTEEIIHNLSLTINEGETHALMGPNGSGKSTLANTIMGHPGFKITSGKIFFKGQDITHMETHKRARLGLFSSFQHPVAIPGVSVTNFLKTAVNSVHGEMPVRDFRMMFMENMKALQIDPAFTSRHLNDGFSGGEKKKLEILQLAMLKPSLAILDEIDSGLDVDAINTVAQGVHELTPPHMATILITHYQRLLDLIKPEIVHIFAKGRILKTGGFELVEKVEKEGYDWLAGEAQLR